MLLKLKKKPPKLSIRDFYNKRNKILLMRDARGIGDILTCRMLFKAFKDTMPECHLTFACWKEYHDLVKDHPYVDEVIESRGLKRETYLISYEITTPCIYYESRKGINGDKHRADIWAEHCGLILTEHDMHIPFIPPETLIDGQLKLKQIRQMSLMINNKDNPSVLFSPLSYDKVRSLTDNQIKKTVEILRNKGLFVYSTHYQDVPILNQLDVPVLSCRTSAEWMALIHAANYVVTVDTATFHYAGGAKKPMVGIFTHVDGKLRGKYFDFILVQKHKDNGDWPCGPCYTYTNCTNPRCEKDSDLRPCLTELKFNEIEEGIDKMLQKYSI
jgi:ADP-heptose:LPS heptosyltransferase